MMFTHRPDLFKPSEGFVRLVYKNIFNRMPEDKQKQIIAFTQEQVKHVFFYLIESVYNWEVCSECLDNFFWIVVDGHSVRKEFMDVFKSRLDLHYLASTEGDLLNMRLAGETANWSLLNPVESSRCKLMWKNQNGKRYLGLVRKKAIEPMFCG